MAKFEVLHVFHFCKRHETCQKNCHKSDGAFDNFITGLFEPTGYMVTENSRRERVRLEEKGEETTDGGI